MCSGAVFEARVADEKEIAKQVMQAKRKAAQNLSICGRADITRAIATAQSAMVNANSKPPENPVVELGGAMVAAMQAMMAARRETIPIVCLSVSMELAQRPNAQ